jgi:predicted metal-dependent hydrolase
MGDLFRKGIEEFNTQSFFEAHDTWEELWRGTSGPDRLFYQGLIQTAVGLYHLTNGNVRGARSQFGKALDKLERYLPAYLGIDTEHLIGEVRACLVCAGDSGEDGAVRFDLPPAPEIRMS